jgi:hypothetical protein
MNTSRFEVGDMLKLLRRSENDREIRNFFGPAMSSIKRDEYYGSLEFKPEGVEAVFREAPWVLPAAEIADPKMLYLSAFHMHRDGHEGYSGYSGQLPNGVALGDTEVELIRKMGQPAVTGGGAMSTVLKRPVPRWLRYLLSDDNLQFQLDANGRIEMATLSAPDVQPKRK